MNFLNAIFILILLNREIKCDYVLDIKMEYFKNEAVQNENKKLYFNYCLISNTNSHQCDSKFETNILGENMIDQEQFSLTTDSINFKILEEQIRNRDYFLNLSISVMSNSNELISNWNLYIEKNSSNLFQLNKWIKFNQINFELKQQLTFNYKLKCSDNYEGSSCNIPICSSGCDLNKGGYCEKPNQCLCKPGWFGSNCELESKCDLDCKNGGVCVIENNQQFCKCNTKFYKGDLCEIRVVHSCNQKCLNGGSCLPNGDCLCAPGYSGDRCQIKKTISECGSFTCSNDGICFIDNQNEYSCICKKGFYGKNCDKQFKNMIQTQETPSTSTQITLSSTIVSQTLSVSNPVLISFKEVQSSTRSFSNQEITLILIAGIGIPILAILVAIIFHKMVLSNKKEDSNENFGKKPVQVNNSRDDNRSNKKENIYVVCHTSDFNKKEDSIENKNEIESKKVTKSSQFESEVYSNCIYDEINEYANLAKKTQIQTNINSNLYSNDLISYV